MHAPVLDDNAWAYFSGGAADEITLRANKSCLGPPAPCCRACCAAGRRAHPGELLGRTLAHPMLLAPVAYQRWPMPDGEMAMAMPPPRWAPAWC
jgi:4-hydroxymandelate oxidase